MGREEIQWGGGRVRGLGVEGGLGWTGVSRLVTGRLVHSAIQYAVIAGRKSGTLGHKGNIMKYTEGAVRDWGYQVAKDFFGAEEIDGGPWCRIPAGKPGAGIVIKDALAGIPLQQALTRPDEFDHIATPNPTGHHPSYPPAAAAGALAAPRRRPTALPG